jgi:hypothetical protein
VHGPPDQHLLVGPEEEREAEAQAPDSQPGGDGERCGGDGETEGAREDLVAEPTSRPE